MFILQGRSFALRKDRIFNLKSFSLPIGSSLYDVKNQYYLCPDQDGNVIVREDGKYTIRYPFQSTKGVNDSEEHHDDIHQVMDNDDEKEKNNSFMKFCQEYRNAHPNEKNNVNELTEKWKALDDTTKREKHGWKNKNIIIKEQKETKKQENDHNKKRKRVDHKENGHVVAVANPKNNKKQKTIDDNENAEKIKKLKIIKEENQPTSKNMIKENKGKTINNMIQKENKDSFFDSLFGDDNE